MWMKYWLLRPEVRGAGQCKGGCERTLQRLMRWSVDDEEGGRSRETEPKRVTLFNQLLYNQNIL